MRKEGDTRTPKENKVNQEMPKITITFEDVKTKLDKLKIDNYPRLDKVHPKCLRKTKTINVPLSILFNQSMDEQTLPNEWKQAQVSAIYKKGNKRLACKYRSVSLTSIVCNTTESIVRYHINEFMKQNKLFSYKHWKINNVTTVGSVRQVDTRCGSHIFRLEHH